MSALDGLLILGALCIVAALAGSVSGFGVRIPALTSPPLRVALGITGAALMFVPLAVMFSSHSEKREVFGPEPTHTDTPTPPPPEPAPPTPPSRDPAPPTSPKRESGSSRSSFTQAVNTECSKSAKKLDSMPNPASNDEHIQSSFDTSDELKRLWKSLNEIRPPSGADSIYISMLNQLGEMASATEKAGSALEAGDPWGYSQEWDRYGIVARNFARFARELNLDACIAVSGETQS
ncbi:hypothetical protein [Actinopolymorpha cephalotaxi]|nr:hypothetical protein [Actinopolymorpha cephalotaxi]NYH84032.1 hypothetical protein [Actinopolymorpha cephalotaxi]